MDPATIAAASDWSRPQTSSVRSMKVKRQAPLPPLSSPPPPPSGNAVMSGKGVTPDLSAISQVEWHSATGDVLYGNQSSVVVPLGSDLLGGAGPGGRESSSPVCPRVIRYGPSHPVFLSIEEESPRFSGSSLQDSLHLADLFESARILDATSNGAWTSEEEGEESTVVETTPTISVLLQPTLPPTRQSRVKLL